ncbi:MAG TPA: mycothiol system anti-sigma-R factor [Acidimicrobiia bacterium]|nr:mycothiol system anti-sigma-R factor [Acidimicrobiia bacterium]HLF60184.1 mycothiol system anti-sigma-R factor [Acidimicrobiia bacterium]
MSGGKCDEALTNLYQYLDREMGAADSERIRAHLDDCSGCFDIYEFEIRLRVVVRERLSEEVPPEFIERLRSALARESVEGR